MYTHIYTHICTCVCGCEADACTHAHNKYTHTSTRAHTHTHTHNHIHIHTHTNTDASTQSYTQTYTHANLNVFQYAAVVYPRDDVESWTVSLPSTAARPFGRFRANEGLRSLPEVRTRPCTHLRSSPPAKTGQFENLEPYPFFSWLPRPTSTDWVNRKLSYIILVKSVDPPHIIPKERMATIFQYGRQPYFRLAYFWLHIIYS